MASRSVSEQSLSITRREWDDLQDVLTAFETLNQLDLDEAPRDALAKSVEVQFRQLVRRMGSRFHREATDEQ